MKESSTRKYIVCRGLSRKSPFVSISSFLYRNLVVKNLKIDNIILKMQQKWFQRWLIILKKSQISKVRHYNEVMRFSLTTLPERVERAFFGEGGRT